MNSEANQILKLMNKKVPQDSLNSLAFQKIQEALRFLNAT